MKIIPQHVCHLFSWKYSCMILALIIESWLPLALALERVKIFLMEQFFIRKSCFSKIEMFHGNVSTSLKFLMKN